MDGEFDLCQEVTTSEFGVKCRMPDKLRAVQELNKMTGAYTPEEVKVTTDLSFKALLKGLKSSELVGGKKEGGIRPAGKNLDEQGGREAALLFEAASTCRACLRRLLFSLDGFYCLQA